MAAAAATLVLAAVAAALARPAAGCASDLDCSLNGDCVGGKCACDAAWEGEQCERFATLPTPPGMDIKEENVTTWGGQAVQHDGEFHMFVSEYVGNCGITAWLTNSQTVRFVSATPKGPWTRKEVVIKGYSTCPSAAITSNGTVVLWAMGGGGGGGPRLGPDAWGNRCEGGASPCGFAKHGCGPNAPPPKRPPPAPPDPPGEAGCASFAAAAGYTCAPRSCLSDGSKSPGHCGAGLCTGGGANSTLCAPLECAPYTACSEAAAARCDADARCHGFALFEQSWRGNSAQFFGKGRAGLTPQP